MFSTDDLNSVFDPPPGSVETSTINFFPALAGSVSISGPRIGGVGVAILTTGSAGDGDGVGVGSGFATISGFFCNSRVTRCSKLPFGPRTTVVSFTNPTPGKNQRSSFADMTDESSQ